MHQRQRMFLGTLEILFGKTYNGSTAAIRFFLEIPSARGVVGDGRASPTRTTKTGHTGARGGCAPRVWPRTS